VCVCVCVCVCLWRPANSVNDELEAIFPEVVICSLNRFLPTLDSFLVNLYYIHVIANVIPDNYILI
jgi:hypothetical protein